MNRESCFERDTRCEIRDTKMVVGLGNPGDEYVDTRHNVGFRVIDSLAEWLRIDLRKKKFGSLPRSVALVGDGEFAAKRLILLKPWQFMNRSGSATKRALAHYGLVVDDLLVITDDMALSPGRIRIRAKGSAGGHNGLDDVIEKLGTESIGRLRIGIGQSGEEVAVDYVLDKPTEVEKPLLDEAIERAREALLCWVEYGIEVAMNKFNSGSE